MTSEISGTLILPLSRSVMFRITLSFSFRNSRVVWLAGGGGGTGSGRLKGSDNNEVIRGGGVDGGFWEG